MKENVWVAKSAKVFDTAYIGAPCIIGENTEVRQSAFIRGDALVGNKCVIGNSAELKNVIISNNCEAAIRSSASTHTWAQAPSHRT